MKGIVDLLGLPKGSYAWWLDSLIWVKPIDIQKPGKFFSLAPEEQPVYRLCLSGLGSSRAAFCRGRLRLGI